MKYFVFVPEVWCNSSALALALALALAPSPSPSLIAQGCRKQSSCGEALAHMHMQSQEGGGGGCEHTLPGFYIARD